MGDSWETHDSVVFDLCVMGTVATEGHVRESASTVSYSVPEPFSFPRRQLWTSLAPGREDRASDCATRAPPAYGVP